jgi:Na+-driven multidrug efflux pump
MGMTILIGEKTGMGQTEKSGQIAGSGILLFTVIGITATALIAILSPQLAAIMQV